MEEITEMADGTYQADVLLTGGSGRAGITSPAEITVEQKEATIQIEWSSPNYDYMIVDGIRYYPVSGKETSVFEIPLTMDEPVEMVADTTAMSVPHEIAYTLTVDSASLKSTEGTGNIVLPVLLLLLAGILAGGIVRYRCSKGKRKRK